MPKERTKESGVPIGTKLKRQLPFRPKDIRLPRERADDRDPRLPPAGPLEGVREGLEVIKNVGRQSRRSNGRSRGRNA
jgi:hypothetical protein